jgi:hypothetical protein
MKISITAVSANRLFGKALTRIASLIDLLEIAVRDIDTTDEPFDVLQLVFMDRPPDYIKPIGTKRGDRLFQVEVGIPSSEALREETLRHEVASRVEMAVSVSSLSEEKKNEILLKLE